MIMHDQIAHKKNLTRVKIALLGSSILFGLALASPAQAQRVSVGNA